MRNGVKCLLLFGVSCALAPRLSAETYFTGPYGPGGTWNLYEVRARGDNARYRGAGDPARSWVDANGTATSLVEPLSGNNHHGHLVSFSGSAAMDENAFVAGKISSMVVGPNVWIGLTDSPAFGGGEAGSNPTTAGQRGLGGAPGDGVGWKWTSGEIFDFFHWGGGVPDDSKHPNGVMMNRAGFWDDRPSGEVSSESPVLLPYVVEYEVHAATDFAVPSPTVSHVPGPAGGWGYFGVRELYKGPEITWTIPAIGELFDPPAGSLVKDYTAPVVDYSDRVPFPNSSHFGNVREFQVVADGNEDSLSVENLALVAHGRIRIPEGQAGDWTFDVNSDDGFELWIDGHSFTSTMSPNTTISKYGSLQCAFDRSAGDSLGVINLPAGDHDLEVVYYEHSGSSILEVSAARGALTSFSPDFQLVGGRALEVHGSTPRVSQDFTVDLVKRVSEVRDPINNLSEAAALLAQPGANDVVETRHQATIDLGIFGTFRSDQGLLDQDVAVHAATNLVIEEGGLYTFGFESSGGARLTIHNAHFNSVSGAGQIVADGQGLEADLVIGDGRTWGTVELQPGEYALEFLAFNADHDGLAELYVAPGSLPFFDRDAFRLLGPAAELVNVSRIAGLQLVGDVVPGDANADGRVDLADFGILKANFGSGSTLSQGDFNGDARVDLADFGILKSNFGQSGVISVPEPSGAALFLLGLPLLAALLSSGRCRTARPARNRAMRRSTDSSRITPGRL